MGLIGSRGLSRNEASASSRHSECRPRTLNIDPFTQCAKAQLRLSVSARSPYPIASRT